MYCSVIGVVVTASMVGVDSGLGFPLDRFCRKKGQQCVFPWSRGAIFLHEAQMLLAGFAVLLNPAYCLAALIWTTFSHKSKTNGDQ